MKYSPEQRRILERLEHRKKVKGDPCDSCYGTGGHQNTVCSDCLGQGVLLTLEEYRTILTIAGFIGYDVQS